MARPFSLRDLALIHRLSEKGALLHAETALTKNWQPLWGALHSLFTGGDDLTFVWRAEKGEAAGFVQLHISDDSARACLIYLGATNGRDLAPAGELPETPPDELPTPDSNQPLEDVWLPLLDGVVAEVGRRGVHSLVAEVDELSPQLALLRQAGFAIYTRQDIWVCEGPVAGEAPAGVPHLLSSYHPEDDWEMALLYAHIVPPLIQMVEPGPPEDGTLWVLREHGDELTAFVHVQDGPGASWLRFFIHPNAQAQASDIIRAALQLSPPREGHPVYCCVRRYQSWLQTELAREGFSLWGSQAVMVKHTVHKVRSEAPELSPALQTQGVTTPPTPFTRPYRPERSLTSKKRLKARVPPHA